MRIAIVDDLAQERELLKSRLERQLERRKLTAAILEYESGDAFLRADRLQSFDVAFLDIYMPGLNGMETARTLRKGNKTCLLIFTTTSTDHALEGFRVRAMDYLVKPFTEGDIDRLVGELLLRLPPPERYVVLKVEGKELHLGCGKIVYAEHFAHMIYVHTAARGVLATRMPFKAFLELLKEEPGFFVCGRGTVVNLAHAVKFEEGAFRMDEGSRVLVGREQTREARQALMEYLLQRGPGE